MAKINKAQKRTLRIVYNGYEKYIEKSHAIVAGTTIHSHKASTILMTEPRIYVEIFSYKKV